MALLFAACSSGDNAPTGLAADATGHEPTGRVGVDHCATPQTGCACEDDGQAVSCGHTTQTFDDYVTCSMGKRTCIDGAWGECVGDRVVQVDTPSPQHGFVIQSLGSGAKCPAGFDACDPYCYQTVDAPGGIGAGSNFVDSSSGLKLAPSAATACTTLTLTATPASITVTQISPLVATTVAITATVNAGCSAAIPFNVTWTVDRFDLAQVTGSTSANGSLTALRPVTGKVRVTGYAFGINNYVDVPVKLSVAVAGN